MNFTNILFLITLLGYPITTIILSRFIEFNRRISSIIKPIFICFLIHNILFFWGWSLRGNHVDYIIFSLEYFLICFTLFSLPANINKYLRIFRFLAIVFVSLGTIIGFLGILLFPFITQDYEPTRTFRFNNEGAFYETKGYTVGAAFTSNTRYTFETYRIFKYLPIEHKLNKTDLFEFDTTIDMNAPSLQISIKTIEGHNQIQFWSGTQFIYRKTLD